MQEIGKYVVYACQSKNGTHNYLSYFMTHSRFWPLKFSKKATGQSKWLIFEFFKTFAMIEFPLQPIDLVREPFRVLNTNNQSWKMNKNKSESGLSFRNKKSSKLSTPKIQNFTTSAIFIGQSSVNMADIVLLLMTHNGYYRPDRSAIRLSRL